MAKEQLGQSSAGQGVDESEKAAADQGQED
jgi:hypothetical protein